MSKEVFVGNGFYIDPSKKYSDDFYDSYQRAFVPNKKNKYVYSFIKRLFDIFVSFFLLVFFAIPFLIIGIIVKCDTKSSAIFKGRRVGKDGKVFNCWKFRSMRSDAPKEEATSLFKDASNYITKSGRVLRKTSIDELPQLINVLTGKMSIIGYRPLITTEVNCNEMRNALGVFRMKPGISGFAQVKGRDDVYYKNKAILDSYYVDNASLWMDIKIIIESVFVVVSRRGNKDNDNEGEKTT